MRRNGALCERDQSGQGYCGTVSGYVVEVEEQEGPSHPKGTGSTRWTLSLRVQPPSASLFQMAILIAASMLKSSFVASSLLIELAKCSCIFYFSGFKFKSFKGYACTPSPFHLSPYFTSTKFKTAKGDFPSLIDWQGENLVYQTQTSICNQKKYLTLLYMHNARKAPLSSKILITLV